MALVVEEELYHIRALFGRSWNPLGRANLMKWAFLGGRFNTVYKYLSPFANFPVKKATLGLIFSLILCKLELYLLVIRKTVFIAFILCLNFVHSLKGQNSIFFTPNKGQWDSRIQYQMLVPGGYFYLENNALTYLFMDKEHKHHDTEEHEEPIKWHAFQVQFKGANKNVKFEQSRQTSFYFNYFLGKDPLKWQSGVYSYHQIRYENLYSGIDYVIGENKGELKADYIVKPFAQPEKIQLEIKGADKVKIVSGELIITTSLAEVKEQKPYAYQIINSEKKEIPCAYRLSDNTVSFVLGKYDTSKELIIDPVLYFSSFIGSTADNFGCTATYDRNKHVFGGALVYSTGVYPTTLGAYQTTFAGSSSFRDMGITKFDSTGTYLHYSTYLGGSDGTEVPHSLVCDNNGNLYVLGTTGSTDYPVSATAFDNTFNGGPAVSAPSQGLNYPTGTDIIITKFNSTGTALLGSTYLGGSNIDGVNNSAVLNYNYGDFIRGEIILDNTGNPIICSNTFSTDYPVTASAPQSANAGSCDAVITKLNSSLSGLIWSTYYGGTGDDAGYGMQPDLSGDLFFTGGTTSADIPVTAGVFDNTSNGGVDGFLAKINNAGSSFLASTYLGTNSYDQSYLVQVDNSNDVYVFGQTTGAYPVSTGIYNVPNSGQFIHKFNNSLTASVWSTRIGTGSGQIDISPTAFLVNNCYKIFICGWGGTVNHFGLADFSTTSGLPVTASGFQTSTDGSDFYLAIFSEDMAGMEYGTFFGGALSSEHVDGGTARFDKDGFVYQAVCAGCGGHDDFPTTPGAWSNTNDSPNCNLAVFKFNLENVIASFDTTLLSPACTMPYSVTFSNTSTFTSSFSWDFGDGTTSTDPNPTHVYTVPGDYVVSLIATDTTPCNNSDTFSMNVHVPEPLSLTNPGNSFLCEGDSLSVSFTATGVDYVWSPTTYLSDPSGSNVTITPADDITYNVIGTNDDGCKDTVVFSVDVNHPPDASFDLNLTPCVLPAQLILSNTSSDAVIYTWYLDGQVFNATDLMYSFTTPGTYEIVLVAQDTSFCAFSDTATDVVIVPPIVTATATGSDTICTLTPMPVSATGGSTYQWFPSNLFSDPNSSSTMITAEETVDAYVVVTDTNGCSDTAYISMYVFPTPEIDAGNDLIYDLGDGPQLFPSFPVGGSYYWTPSEGLSCVACPNPEAAPDQTTTYYLVYTDVYGCTFTDSVIVYVTPSVFIPNAFTANGDGVNDVFIPVVRNLSYFQIEIFNRWGEMIFKAEGLNVIWDGTHNGKKAKEDVYVWKIKYASQIEPEVYREKVGHVSLLR